MLHFSRENYKYKIVLGYVVGLLRVRVTHSLTIFLTALFPEGYSRDSSLAQSVSQLLVLAQVLPVRGCGLSVRFDTSFTSSKQFSLSSSSFLFFSVPISASTENACALRLIVHGDRRFSAIVTNQEDRFAEKKFTRSAFATALNLAFLESE